MAKPRTKFRQEISTKLEALKTDKVEDFNSIYKEVFHSALYDEVIGIAPKDVGNYDLLALAFEDIGDKLAGLGIYSSDDNVNKRCKYFTDALLNYQYSMQIMGNFECGWESHSIASIKEKAKNLYLEFHKFIGNGSAIDSEELLDRISYKSEIQELRAKARLEISNIKEIPVGAEYKVTYAEKANGLFEEITAGMKHYLASIISDAEKFCGPIPCAYSVIGLGSMAMKQITPYSDLEFAILVGEDNPANQEYFAKLGHYVNFAVTALGETTLPTSQYGINLDHLVKKAVNLDLGGKTSLGREDKDYKLVCTVDEMLKNMTGEHNETISDPKKIDEKLPLILGNVCHVTGDLPLTQGYVERANEFLSSFIPDRTFTHSQQRAIEVLTKDGVTRKANLDEFKFQRFAKEGQLFDVKQEIYRIPDRMIYNLGQLFGICQAEGGVSANEVITQLHKKGIIKEDAALNFRFAISYANTLRLRVYDFYRKQEEDINPLPEVDGLEDNKFRIAERETKFSESEDILDGDLIEFYYIIIPLMDNLKQFCENIEINNEVSQEYFDEYHFRDSSNDTKSDIARRLLQHDKVIEYAKKALEATEDKEEKILLYDAIALSYKYKGMYNEALELLLKIAKIKQEALQENLANSAVRYNDIGATYHYIAAVYNEQQKNQDAKENSEKALEMMRKDPEKNDNHMAVCLGNIGLSYWKLQEYDKALEFLEEALHFRGKLLDSDRQNTASVYLNIGLVYFNKKEFDKALDYYMKSLAIKKLDLAVNHPGFASLYNNIGHAYGEKGQYDKALEYCTKSLTIRVKFHGEDYPDVAYSYINIYKIHKENKNYLLAFENCKKALEIWEVNYKEDPLQTRILYKYVVDELEKLGRFKEAAKYQVKELQFIAAHIGKNSEAYQERGSAFKENLDRHKTVLAGHDELGRNSKIIDKSEAKILKNPKKFNSEKRHALKEAEDNLLAFYKIICELHQKSLSIDYLHEIIRLYGITKNDSKLTEYKEALSSLQEEYAVEILGQE